MVRSFMIHSLDNLKMCSLCNYDEISVLSFTSSVSNISIKLSWTGLKENLSRGSRPDRTEARFAESLRANSRLESWDIYLIIILYKLRIPKTNLYWTFVVLERQTLNLIWYHVLKSLE